MKFFETALGIEFGAVEPEAKMGENGVNFNENCVNFNENSVNSFEKSGENSQNPVNSNENSRISVNLNKNSQNSVNFNEISVNSFKKPTPNPQEFTHSKKECLAEFHKLGTISLSKWKQLAAKADFSDSEELLFRLLLSVKGDLMRIEDKLQGANSLLSLPCKDFIKAINFDGFELGGESQLCENAEYYARIVLNRQNIGFFFKASGAKCALITLMKNEDRQNYDKFVVEAQRQLINSAQKDEK